MRIAAPASPAQLPVATRKPQATSLPQKRAYTSPDLGFSLDYPNDWEINAKNVAQNGVLFYRVGVETIFWVQQQRFGGSADKANQAGIAFLKETNQGANIKDVTYAGNPVALRAAGLTGLSLDYTYTRGSTAMQGVFVAVTTAEGDTYLITMEARRADYPQDALLLKRAYQLKNTADIIDGRPTDLLRALHDDLGADAVA